jgi:hypothetical protein
MKKLSTLLALIIFAVSVNFAQGGGELGPKIQFEAEEHDFGSGPQGTPVSHEFVFKNVGNAPLVLLDVKASCGCTTPSWPKEPIMPGQEGKILTKYNMARAGSYRKSITVTTKGDGVDGVGDRVVLYIKGNTIATEGSVEENVPSIIVEPK